MSVMVIREEKFVALKMFLTMKEIEEHKVKINKDRAGAWGKVLVEKYINMVNYFYQMNVLNYCQRYDEEVFFAPIDFSEDAPYPTQKEAVDIMKSIRYNTCDYFETPELDALIEKYSEEKRKFDKQTEMPVRIDRVHLTDTDMFLVAEDTVDDYLLKTMVREDVLDEDGDIDSTITCDFAASVGLLNIGDVGEGFVFVGNKNEIAGHDEEFHKYISDIEAGRV